MKFPLAVLLSFHLLAAAADDLPNARLSQLVAEDQELRRGVITQEQWPAIVKADAERRKEVLGMLAAGAIRLPIDYEHAALIMQHGQYPSDYRLAHALATIAYSLDPERRQAKWLQAASWDRLLNSLGRLQWYGTQKRLDATSGSLVPLPVDLTVSNAHRMEMGQPPVAPE